VIGRHIPLGILFLLLSAPLAAQAADPAELFSASVDVRVVNVEVFVTDTKGRPVTGLTRDDFVLQVDGQPAEIEYFLAVDADEAAATPTPRQAGAPVVVPLDVDQSAGGDDLVVAVVLDELWLTPFDRRRILGDLDHFLEAQPVDARVVLASLGNGLELLTPVTRDRGLLRAALADRVEPPLHGLQAATDRRSAFRDIRSIYEEYDPPPPGCEDPCDCGRYQMLGVWEAYVAQTVQRIAATFAEVEELLAVLSGIPDRKAILYVGSGFDQRPGLDMLQYLIEICPLKYEREFSSYMLRYDEGPTLLDLAARANANRATLYTLDAGGLRADEASDVENLSAHLRVSGLVSQIHRSNVQAPFQILAGATGGQAILNANRPFDDLMRLESDFRHVYSLGFAPPGEADGKTHRVKVALREERHGVDVRFRTSYVDKKLDRRLVERAIAAMALGQESNPLYVRARVGDIVAQAPKVIQVPIEVEVDVAALALVPGADGVDSGRFRVFLAARSPDGGRTEVREKFFAVTPEGLADGVEKIVVNINLEPGPYTIAVGVRDEIGTETSYLAVETDGVPAGSG
jgi:VWFA-related protein